MIDVAPAMRGMWINEGHDEWSVYTRCSVCRRLFHTAVNEYNYCPNCGAKMKGEQDG